MQLEITSRPVTDYIPRTSVQVSIFDTISAVPASDWLRFIPETNPLLQPRYLRRLEDTQRGQMEFIYALLHLQGRLIGACYFQVVRFTGTNLVSYFPAPSIGRYSFLKNAFMNWSKAIVAQIDMPILVSGNLFITGEQGLYFLSEFSELEKSYFLSHAIDHILRERKHIKTVLLPDMYEPSGDFDMAFIRNSYRRIFVEADMSMSLPVHWHSFDDYMNAISSKYRVRAKKILHTSLAISGREMTIEDVSTHLDRLYEIYKAVADKADFNIAKFPKAYFLEEKKSSPDLYKIFGYYLDEKLVGFMSLFILPGKTEVHYCGIDYSINKDYSLYQRMLYDIVRYAIEHDLRKLHFGRTAPEVKSTLGAIPHPMYGYVRHRNPIVNSLLGIFTGRLKPREYTLRNPFK